MGTNFLGYYVGFPFSNPVVRFYAICIRLGACVALLLSNYRAHKDGFDWHFFDTVFPLALISGIIGARIWYVIACWDQYAGGPIWRIFDMRQGGLAIQGGAIGGVLVGVLYCIFRRKGTTILKIMDFAVPTIIVAQAIGRWGNFFNQEVFGHAVDPSSWAFLPSFITNNMQNGTMQMGTYVYNGTTITAASNGVILPKGSIAAPMFLVEGVINILFYFVITKGLPVLLGKHYKNGDQSFAYFIAYGIIRMTLEPLRNPHFIMGDASAGKADYKSYTMAIAFIGIGLLLIVINHLLHHFAEKGKFDFHPFLKSVFVEEEAQAVLEVSSPVVNIESKKVENNNEIVEEESDFMKKLKSKEDDIKNDKDQR